MLEREGNEGTDIHCLWGRARSVAKNHRIKEKGGEAAYRLMPWKEREEFPPFTKSMRQREIKNKRIKKSVKKWSTTIERLIKNRINPFLKVWKKKKRGGGFYGQT